MHITRRGFLTSLGALGAPLALLGGIRVVLAQPGATPGDTLVCLFLRGAMDGLSLLVPHGEDAYYALRPNLAIPEPGTPGGALDLDGFFGLHPQLAPLADLYFAGRLAFVHATGSPDPSHSHFESQDFMEKGTPGDKTTEDGWIGRHLATVNGAPSPFRAVGLGDRVQKSLLGEVPATAVASIDGFGLITQQHGLTQLEANLRALYLGDQSLDLQAQAAFAAVDQFQLADPGQYPPANGAQYPGSPLGQALKQVAQLIRSGIGIEAICVDAGGWDTHQGQTSALNSRFGDLAASLSAFDTDIAAAGGLLLAGMTEFGRRAYENASGGTDHGHGSCMFLLGNGVNGGLVHGDWPGLMTNQLYGNGDLEVANDFRTVLSEVAVKRLGANDPEVLFPGFGQTPFLGVCEPV